jgi:hypothetical protein
MKEVFLSRITHARLSMTKDRDKAFKTGIYGILRLCFGPSDADSICQIQLVKAGSELSWKLPQVQINGTYHAVFTGKIADEVALRANEVYNAIKANFGKAKPGHVYRIAGSKVVDETEAAQTQKC